MKYPIEQRINISIGVGTLPFSFTTLMPKSLFPGVVCQEDDMKIALYIPSTSRGNMCFAKNKGL